MWWSNRPKSLLPDVSSLDAERLPVVFIVLAILFWVVMQTLLSVAYDREIKAQQDRQGSEASGTAVLAVGSGTPALPQPYPSRAFSEGPPFGPEPVLGPAPGLLEPFWRFTLFSRRGAEIPPNQVNRLETDVAGRVLEGPPPLVLAHERLPLGWVKRAAEGTPPLPLEFSPTSFLASPEKRGWVFLGGRNDRLLTLHLTAGRTGRPGLDEVGEGHLLWWDAPSMGWRSDPVWTKRLQEAGAFAEAGAQIVRVDSGLWKTAVDLEFGGLPMFPRVLSANVGGGKSSALHLFGWPEAPSPTLVFGLVRHRFLRSHGLYFPTVRTVHPMPAMSEKRWKEEFPVNVQDRLERFGEVADNLRSGMKRLPEVIGHGEYWLGSAPLGLEPLMPGLVSGPAVAALPLLASPAIQNGSWKEMVASLAPSIPLPAVPMDLPLTVGLPDGAPPFPPWRKLVESARFLGPAEAGSLPRDETGREVFRFSEQSSRLGSILSRKADGTWCLSLRGVVILPGRVVIDLPLSVEGGGVLMVTVEVQIIASITNPALADPTRPLRDGFMTIIAPRIHLKLPVPPEGPIPEVHAFLVAMDHTGTGQVLADRPVHLIGGVATDLLSGLVSSGGIIEYLFRADDYPSLPGKDKARPPP